MLRSALRVAAEWHRRLTARQDASGRKGEDAARQQRAHLQRSAGITQTVRTEVLQRFMNNPGKNALAVHNGSQACPQTEKTRGNASQPEKQLAAYHGRLSRSEFHEGQVPLKASGSCSWCWYSSRHIQRVENILSAHHIDRCQAMSGLPKRRGALPCAGGACQQESTPSSAAAGFYPDRAQRPSRAAGRHAAA